MDAVLPDGFNALVDSLGALKRRAQELVDAEGLVSHLEAGGGPMPLPETAPKQRISEKIIAARKAREALGTAQPSRLTTSQSLPALKVSQPRVPSVEDAAAPAPIGLGKKARQFT